jgi:hypothetical protein
MISDERIIELIAAKRANRKILFNNEFDDTFYQVEEDHFWDFRKNNYVLEEEQ